MILLTFILQTTLMGISAAGSGECILKYEPKSCFMPPCPQFRLQEMNGVVSKVVGVDLKEADSKKEYNYKKISMGDCLRVQGSWKKTQSYMILYYSKEPEILGKVPQCQD